MNSDGRPSWDSIWMEFATTIARRSYDPRHQVGAVIVTEKNTQVLAIGYNGNYSGGPNEVESTTPGESGMIHAEINALIKSFDEKDFFSKKNDHFKTAILSDLEEISIDKDGRFTLRDPHKIFSKIKKDLIFIGKGNHFEIWQQDLGEKHKLESRKKFK